MRFIGLDVHRDFCEVAIAEAGEVQLAGRVQTEPAALALFAQSLGGEDEVALEATGNALRIARIIEPHVGRVVLANPKAVKGITRAGAKTDKIDARTLAQLLAGGFLPAVWLPDEQTRILRRRISARAQLVRQRTRAKNQVHATLIRNLKGKPPVSDLFGVRGRRWLAAQELPADERETVAACLRQIAFLDGEIALVERALAEQVLASVEMRRLLTLPGVNFVTAAALLAAIGDIARFPSARQLVSYLGLDPRVNQSGSEPARHGRISKQGPGETRHVLNANLVELGYATRAQLDPSSDSFSSATASALRKLQAKLGANQTGSLAFGRAVFLPESVRIATVSRQVGASAQPGAQVLSATSDRLEVQLALDPSQQGAVKKGDRAQITLPSNRSVTGKIDRLGRVAQVPAAQNTSTSGATIPVYISLDHPGQAGGLDQAPIQVNITTKGVTDALNVPVTAIVGRSGGGFAVELVRADGSRALVAVKLGLFDSAGGRVQIEGELHVADRVVVPS